MRIITSIGIAVVLATGINTAARATDWVSDGSFARRALVDARYQPVTADPNSSAYWNHPAYRHAPQAGYRYGPGSPVDEHHAARPISAGRWNDPAIVCARRPSAAPAFASSDVSPGTHCRRVRVSTPEGPRNAIVCR